MSNARQTAFKILLKIHRSGAYSNLALDAALKEEDVSREDAALTGAIVYTVLERMLTIDYNLSKYLSQPIKKLRPEVHTALRIGCCQILFMDKIPDSAAVNESVALVKNNKCSFAAGLVNAVLRKVSGNGLVLPDETSSDYLSIKYSCPRWLADLWTDSYGKQNAIGIMEDSLGVKPVTVRVNTLKITPDELIKRLESEGVKAESCNALKDALTLERAGAIEKLQAYKDGLFHVQDVSSQLCCEVLGAKPGETVFDMCCAPGGKTFTIAQSMENQGTVIAFDIYEQRLGLVQSGAERLGITNITTAVGDASAYNGKLGQADKVLCDVPCAGLGVIGKKPEIRYKRPQDIDKLGDLQYLILCNSCKYVKKGGMFIYSTCSLNPSENEKICEKFLTEHKSFRSLPILKGIDRYDSGSNFVTLLPHINHSDGFFIAAFSDSE